MKDQPSTPAKKGRPRHHEDGHRQTLTACITATNHKWICALAAEQAGPLAGRKGRALDKVITAARTK